MKRFPNGVNGKAFYQQKAPDVVPPGIRVEDTVDDEGADTDHAAARRRRSQDAALHGAARRSRRIRGSRDDTPHAADYVALDLDPMPGVPFCRCSTSRAGSATSSNAFVPGSRRRRAPGLHVYIPLPEGTSYEAGRLLCEILATIVAHKHRKKRPSSGRVGKRGRTVYVDYLQNILGKTLATAYSPGPARSAASRRR